MLKKSWCIALALCLVSMAGFAQMPDLSSITSSITQYWSFVLFLDSNHSGGISLNEIRTLAPGMTPSLIGALDKNGDGDVTYEEVNNLTILDAVPLVVSLLKAVDKDGNLAITQQEATAFCPLLDSSIFGQIDQNGDGALSLADLTGLVNLPAELPLDKIEDVLRAVLNADINNDVCYSLAEIQAQVPWVPEIVFDLVDINFDGNLCFNDLYVVVDGLVARIADVLGVADANGDGGVDFDEAKALVPQVTADIFSTIDLNGDGVLSLADLKGIVPTPPAPDGPVPDPVTIDSWPSVIKFLTQLNGCFSLADVQMVVPGFPEELFNLLDQIDERPFMRPATDKRICLEGLKSYIEPADVDAIFMILLKYADQDQDGSLFIGEARLLFPVLTESMFSQLDVSRDYFFGYDDLANVIPFLQSLSVPVAPVAPPIIIPTDPLGKWAPIFDKPDTNGDGCLSDEEVAAGFPVIGHVLNVLDVKVGTFLCKDTLVNLDWDTVEGYLIDLLRQAINEVDKDGDNAISLAELQAIIPPITADIFDQIDQNGDGVLSMADLGGIIDQPPPPPPPPPSGGDPLTELLTIAIAADKDHDNCLDWDELESIFPPLSQVPRIMLVGGEALCLSDIGNIDSQMIHSAVSVVLSIADTDHDGAFSFEEAIAFMPALTLNIFTFLDQNADTVLSVKDIPGGTVDPPPPPPTGPLDIIMPLFNAADIDGDGCLTYDEMKTIAPSISEAFFRLLDHIDENPIFDRYGDGLFCPASGFLDGNMLYEVAIQLLQAADADGDLIVTLDELKGFIPGATQEIFSLLDLNGDGSLSPADYGITPPPPPPPANAIEQITQIFMKADANGDGCLTYEEALAIAPTMSNEVFTKIDHIDESGQMIALYSDGTICPLALGPYTPDALFDAAKALIAAADTDGNGAIDLDEAGVFFPDMTKEIFIFLDQNGDHLLSLADLPGGDTGWQPPTDNPTALLQWLFKRADADGDGALTFAELAVAKPNLTQGQFDAMDMNGDGVISAADFQFDLLKQLVKADKDHNGELDYTEIAATFADAPSALLASIDTDHNWSLSRAELIAAMGQNGEGQVVIAPEDEDCDGLVTASDLQLAVNTILGRPIDLLPADVDGNGRIDAVDIQMIVIHILRGN